MSTGDTPALDVRLLDGTSLPSNVFAGHPVVVTFWAAGHPASVAALESLAALPPEAAGAAAFLGVALDADLALATDAAERVAGGDAWEHAFNGRQAEPVDTRFYDAPYGIPAVWLLDGDGRVTWTGHPDDLEPALAEAVTAAGDTPAWGPGVRAARIAWAGVLEAAGSRPEDLLDGAERLSELGELDAATAGPDAAANAAGVVAALAGQPGVERSRLKLAGDADPSGARALIRLRELAGDAAEADAAARRTRVDTLEAARRAEDRNDDAAAMASYAALVEEGPADAPEVIAAAERLEVFRAKGMTADAARAEADAAEAARRLLLARNYAENFREENAVEELEELLERFPESPSAAEAAELKAELEAMLR